ncbi:transglycosylase-like protein with SLT domain [Albidovulum inexpectatum]|uniref:Transglycosylase-like protein with SLT domain n=1 Tax=Albidovulum inexpectatum TaxID=196587 RepID=A0A2S5JGM5_9RHOB|nr:lytic transglycosylase domain-containing protein [Albidovulum inexpectatum]PPB80632.1 transglycosylase-like protein with SLT domain [Albidovulum inexpectatum]
MRAVEWCRVPVVALAILTAGWAKAETLNAKAGGPADFTFKMISPAQAKPGRWITVQIDPEEQARRLAAGPLPPPENPIPRGGAAPGLQPESAPAVSSYDWYWAMVPAALAERSGRFDLALAALARAPEGKAVPAPRLQQMQEIAARHGREILKATVGRNISPALVLAIISVESSGRPDAISPAGAAGLMQLIPATAERFGVADRIDPAENIAGGVAYLEWLMREFDRDPVLVLAAYNAGENAVRKHGGVPPYAETRAYVPKVLAAWLVARGLCVTPPELVTDGCVFAVNG